MRPIAWMLAGLFLMAAGAWQVSSHVVPVQGRAVPVQSPCLLPDGHLDIACTLPGGAHEDADYRRIETEVHATEAAALAQAASGSLDPYQQMVLLGRLELYDENLSPRHTMACITCHVPETGFTSGVSLWNQTIVANPGAEAIANAPAGSPNYRIAPRKPQSYAYATFAPVLQYNASQQELRGGNFWDMRATGNRLQSPAAEQAEGPPTNPVEMALPDPACAVFRIAQGRYRGLFEKIWGAQSFAIRWPADSEQVCSRPGPPPANDPQPLHLSAADRTLASQTYDHMALAIAANEASPETNKFSSKYDAWLQGQYQFTPAEQRGYELFRGKGKCNTCHLDGTANRAGALDRNEIADKAPLFTDFTAANLGLPKNLAMPYYRETHPDTWGFIANPLGFSFVDLGVGGFLRSPGNGNSSTRTAASRFDGRFQTPTLRDVDLRPYPAFVKAYMHNGYLKSLKEVVHFYNTRDVLPRCNGDHDPREKTGCWPAPEVAQNMDRTMGRLGLSDAEENDIVAFLKTLSDGYLKPAASLTLPSQMARPLRAAAHPR